MPLIYAMLLTTSTEKFKLFSFFDAINLALISPNDARSFATFFKLFVSEIWTLLFTFYAINFPDNFSQLTFVSIFFNFPVTKIEPLFTLKDTFSETEEPVKNSISQFNKNYFIVNGSAKTFFLG